MMLQSLMLGLGAYLVISGEASAGVIIASSIMLARALAPVDIAIANWRGFMSARQSYAQLSKTLTAFADRSQPMALPRPQHTLSVEAPDGRRTRAAEAADPERHLQARGGRRAGRDRAERVRQVDAGRAPLSAPGPRCAARSGSTRPRLSNGMSRRSAATSAICRRTSNCSRALSPRTSAASIQTPMRRPSSPQQKRRVSNT